MAAETERLPGLHVVQIRYQGSDPAVPGSDPVDAYAASGAYQRLGEATVVEPEFPEDRRDEEPTINLGLIGGQIAEAVAAGRREGKPVLVVGGNCASVPGVVGGLQEAHGPAAKIGLVWFDAHGDFNTPRTTLSGMLGGMPVAAPAPGFPGEDLERAVRDLADRCDLIYLHVDSDILDERYVPNHRTREPNGPSMEQVLAAIDTVMATGKVVTYAMVAVWADGDGGDVAVDSGVKLIAGGLESWRRHGSPVIASTG